MAKAYKYDGQNHLVSGEGRVKVAIKYGLDVVATGGKHGRKIMTPDGSSIAVSGHDVWANAIFGQMIEHGCDPVKLNAAFKAAKV